MCLWRQLLLKYIGGVLDVSVCSNILGCFRRQFLLESISTKIRKLRKTPFKSKFYHLDFFCNLSLFCCKHSYIYAVFIESTYFCDRQVKKPAIRICQF